LFPKGQHFVSARVGYSYPVVIFNDASSVASAAALAQEVDAWIPEVSRRKRTAERQNGR